MVDLRCDLGQRQPTNGRQKLESTTNAPVLAGSIPKQRRLFRRVVTQRRIQVEYLIVDSSTPKPHGKSIWSARIENAIQFSCFDDANVQKDVVADETEVIRVNDKWYVVKR
jgi:hypothetical protein